MRKFLFLLIALLAGVSGAWADDWTPSIPADVVIKVGEKVSSVTAASSASDNTHWYLVTQLRGGESAIYDNGTTIYRGATTATAASFDNKFATANAAYLVRFISTGSGLYNVQFGTGRYAQNYDSTPGNVAVGTSTTPGAYAFYNCNGGTGSYFGWNLGSETGKSVNNNSAGNTVAFWNTGKRSGTSESDNAIWYVYGVSFEVPDYFYHYTISYGGNVVYTSENFLAGNGDVINTLRSEVQRDFCSYEVTSTTVTAQKVVTNVPVTMTWNGPFTISSDFATASWYLLRMKAGAKNMKYQDGSSAYPLEDVASYDIAEEDYYSWAFLGNPYDLKIVNKQAGSTKKFYQGASVGNGGIPTMSDENESSWTITRGTADTNFGISPNGYSYYLNAWNGGATVQYWSSGPGSDAGSQLTVLAVEDIDFTSMVTSYIQPYIDNPSDAYFAVTSANVTILLADHAEGGSKTSWTKSEYQSYNSALQEAITTPAAGYYVLKNVNSGEYLTYNGRGTADGANNTATAIIKLTPSGAGYTLQMQGAYLKVPNYQEALTTRATPAVFYATIANSTPGQVKIGTDDGAHTYLNYTGGVVQGYQPTTNTGWWILEDAPSTISITLNAAVDNTSANHTYATLCVPFNITALEGANSKEVKAYAPTKSGDYIVPGDGATTVTEGTPVLLIGEEGATSVTATIGSNYATAPATTNVLTGTFTAATIDTRADTGTNYVLGKDDTNGDRIGFYHVNNEEFPLSANRAYLNTAGGSVKGFVISLGDLNVVNEVPDTTAPQEVYDLIGRRVVKPTRGLYISKGQKFVK